MEGHTGKSQLKPEDAKLLASFATLHGTDTTGLIHIAMAALVAQLRAQAPQCASCPHTRPQKPIARPISNNIVSGPWPA